MDVKLVHMDSIKRHSDWQAFGTRHVYVQYRDTWIGMVIGGCIPKCEDAL